MEDLSPFNISVLFAIEELGEKAIGSEIQVNVSKTLNRDVTINRLYATIDKLIDGGYVSSSEDPTPTQHKRLVYKVEPKGKAAALADMDASLKTDSDFSLAT